MRGSDIATFVNYPACKFFKVKNAWNLACLFHFVTIHQNYKVGSFISEFWVLRLKSSDIVSFVKPPVYSSFKIENALDLFS